MVKPLPSPFFGCDRELGSGVGPKTGALEPVTAATVPGICILALETGAGKLMTGKLAIGVTNVKIEDTKPETGAAKLETCVKSEIMEGFPLEEATFDDSKGTG
ncbi:unnamed protein product [Caretta caretta]